MLYNFILFYLINTCTTNSLLLDAIFLFYWITQKEIEKGGEKRKEEERLTPTDLLHCKWTATLIGGEQGCEPKFLHRSMHFILKALDQVFHCLALLLYNFLYWWRRIESVSSCRTRREWKEGMRMWNHSWIFPILSQKDKRLNNGDGDLQSTMVRMTKSISSQRPKVTWSQQKQK